MDLCYRLASAGWRLEFRDEPVVDRIGRENVLALLRQQVKHGQGTGWLNGSCFPASAHRFAGPSLVVSVFRGLVKSGWARVRGQRDRALIEALDPLTALAFHLGRLRSNYVDGGQVS